MLPRSSLAALLNELRNFAGMLLNNYTDDCVVSYYRPQRSRRPAGLLHYLWLPTKIPLQLFPSVPKFLTLPPPCPQACNDTSNDVFAREEFLAQLSYLGLWKQAFGPAILSGWAGRCKRACVLLYPLLT